MWDTHSFFVCRLDFFRFSLLFLCSLLNAQEHNAMNKYGNTHMTTARNTMYYSNFSWIRLAGARSMYVYDLRSKLNGVLCNPCSFSFTWQSDSQTANSGTQCGHMANTLLLLLLLDDLRNPNTAHRQRSDNDDGVTSMGLRRRKYSECCCYNTYIQYIEYIRTVTEGDRQAGRVGQGAKVNTPHSF